MKRLNDWIERVGTDKVLHLLGGFGLYEAMVANSTMLWGHVGYLYSSFVALFIVYALSILKEKWLDDTPDMEDVDFAMFGSAIALALNMSVYMIMILYRVYL